MPAKPVVYNLKVINAWSAAKAVYEQRLSEFLQLIADLRETLSPLKAQLGGFDSEIQALKSRMSILTFQQHGRSHLYRTQYGPHYDQNDELVDAQITLKGIESQRAVLLQQMQIVQQAIDMYNAYLAYAEQQIVRLTKSIDDANTFLRTLRETPLELVSTLKEKILKAFESYEDTHLTGMTPEVRACLWNFKSHLDTLVFSESTGHTQYSYLKLCGFLWDMYHRTETHSDLSKLLEELLNSTHVAETGYLPDNLPNQSAPLITVRDWFNFCRSSCTITVEALPQLESQAFCEELAKLNVLKQKTKLTPLLARIKNAAQLIESEVQGKIKKNEVVDYHFYLRALRQLNILRENPSDINAANRLSRMADYASGTPSVSKKVLGSLLAVCAVLAVSACFALAAAAGPVLIPFALSLGLSLMQSKIALSLGVTFGFSAGVALTFWGESTYKAGLRTGLSKEFKAFEPPAATL